MSYLPIQATTYNTLKFRTNTAGANANRNHLFIAILSDFSLYFIAALSRANTFPTTYANVKRCAVEKTTPT